MGEEPPNPWSTLHTDASTYITLATALLGVTATFSTDLVAGDGLGQLLVFVGWVGLAASIVCSISANGKIFEGLKGNKDEDPEPNFNPVAARLNVAVYLLLAGTFVLALGTLRGASSQGDLPLGALETAQEAVAHVADVPTSEPTFSALNRGADGKFVFTFRIQDSERNFEVVVDEAEEVLSIRET